MVNNSDFIKLNCQVCFPIYAASNLLTRIYRPVLAELDLTYPQYLVMMVLWEASPQSVGALGSQLHLDSNTLTPMLKRMEIKGLLERKRDAADERRVLITLSDAGKELQEAASKVPIALARNLHLSRAELETLRGSVQKLVDSLAPNE